MMNIPDSFKWTSLNIKKLTYKEQELWLLKNEGNIRKCIGEAVPTGVFEWIVFVWLITRKNIHLKEWKYFENQCVKEYKNNPDVKQKHLQKIIIVYLITHTISLLTSTGTLISLVCNHNPFDYINFWPSLSSTATIIDYIFNIRFKKLIKILEKKLRNKNCCFNNLYTYY